jgi:chromate transporter
VSPLAALALHFATLSLLAVGGVNTILPEVHRLTVEVHGWMTSAQFAALFALAQAAPGPNMLVLTLIGWQVAGPAGALVATLATCGPPCALAYTVSRLWDRVPGAPWRLAVEAGLAPVTVGLVLATGSLLALGAGTGPTAYAVTAVSAAALGWTRLNPLWLLAAGAVMGVAGLI